MPNRNGDGPRGNGLRDGSGYSTDQNKSVGNQNKRKGLGRRKDDVKSGSKTGGQKGNC